MQEGVSALLSCGMQQDEAILFGVATEWKVLQVGIDVSLLRILHVQSDDYVVNSSYRRPRAAIHPLLSRAICYITIKEWISLSWFWVGELCRWLFLYLEIVGHGLGLCGCFLKSAKMPIKS